MLAFSTKVIVIYRKCMINHEFMKICNFTLMWKWGSDSSVSFLMALGLAHLDAFIIFSTENQFEITNEALNKVTSCHGSDRQNFLKQNSGPVSLIVLFLWWYGMCVVRGSATSTDVFADITKVWHDLVKQQKWPLTHPAFSSDSFICHTWAIYYHQLRLLASHCFLLPRDKHIYLILLYYFASV